MDLGLFLSAFFVVAISELGDKSFLTVIALSSRYGRRAAFLGAAAALVLMALLAAILGQLLAGLLPQTLIMGLAAALFLIFGILTLREDCEEDCGPNLEGKSALLGSFLLIMLMEMGDKTQVSIFALSAAGDLLSVLLGAVVALVLLTGAAALLGEALGKRLSPRHVQVAAAALFLFFGVLFLAGLIMELLS